MTIQNTKSQDPVDPQLAELLHEHMKLAHLYESILGNRVYRAVRPSKMRDHAFHHRLFR